VKVKLTVLLTFGGILAFGQEEPPGNNPLRSNPVTLASQFFENNNYVNYFGFANGIYDSYAPTLNSSGQSVNNGGFGYQVGGGVSASHTFRRASLSLTYSGGYSDYSSSTFSSGTNQNLGFNYTRRLSRRWTFAFSQGAGSILYGTGYISPSGNSLNLSGDSPSQVALNPFSTNTRYLSSNVNFAYQQTRRWSYVFSGGFFLQRFSNVNSIGMTGGSGSFGVNYRTTPRTTIGVSYNYSSFVYQHDSGDSQINGIQGFVSHQFPNHWFVTVSGGITHSQISGFIVLPATALTGNVGPGGYVTGYYNTGSNFPSFNGSVSRVYRKSQITASAGQSVISGNGYYLASRNQFLSGLFSKSYKRANISAGANWFKLRSAANTVAYDYTSSGVGVSYGYQLMRHLSSNFRYDFIHYGNLPPTPGINDNRLSFGFSLSSKSIPLTLY